MADAVVVPAGSGAGAVVHSQEESASAKSQSEKTETSEDGRTTTTTKQQSESASSKKLEVKKEEKTTEEKAAGGGSKSATSSTVVTKMASTRVRSSSTTTTKVTSSSSTSTTVGTKRAANLTVDTAAAGSAGSDAKGGATTPVKSPPARTTLNKDALLQWCQRVTEGYAHVEIKNFSSSWNNGMAFCALIHRFHPEAFDYSRLDPKRRGGNFNIAFKVAEKFANIAPLLEVEDMVRMKNPDWKCVFTYLLSFYRKFREYDLSTNPPTPPASAQTEKSTVKGEEEGGKQDAEVEKETGEKKPLEQKTATGGQDTETKEEE